MREDTAQSRPQTETVSYDSRPISWWSWRPGIRPRNALLIGTAFSLVALLFISLGAVILAFSIVDSVSPAITVPGIVTHHTIAGLDNAYYLTLRLQTPGFPTSVSAAVSAGAYHTIDDGDHILAEYSPMLHVLNALDSVGQHGQQGQHSQHYVLPNSGAGGILLGAVALLLLGMLLLPYPAILAHWGWRDLYANRHSQQGTLQISGTIVALRAADETQMRRPGLIPRRGVRTWYGVAVLPIKSTENTKHSGAIRVVTFAINQETYQTIEEGTEVTITCSPHLHYVYSLKRTGETGE